MASVSKGVPILPTLVPQLECLKNSPIPFRIEQIRKGHRRSNYADRFTVFVPCCLDYVKWDVLFSSQNPELAPDIVFDQEDHDFQPLVSSGYEMATATTLASLEFLEHLREWSPEDPSRLKKLLTELRLIYLRHKRQRVEVLEDPRVKFEIGTISSMEGLEMRLFTGADRPEAVQFALPLSTDLSKRLGVMAANLWSGISLQVTFPLQQRAQSSFQGGGGGAPQLKLHAPPALRDIFDVDDVKLPTWPDRMCLMEYVPNVESVLEGQVRDAIASIGLRKGFVEALGEAFGRPLEVESILYRKLSLIAASGLFCFLIHISLPTNFPKQQPALIFQSSQHFDVRGKPIFSRPCVDYPWSPRWEANHMAQRVFDFAAEECDRFKKYCMDSLQSR